MTEFWTALERAFPKAEGGRAGATYVYRNPRTGLAEGPRHGTGTSGGFTGTDYRAQGFAEWLNRGGSANSFSQSYPHSIGPEEVRRIRGY